MWVDSWAMKDCVYFQEVGVGAWLRYWSCWMVEGWDASNMGDDEWLEDGMN